MPTFSAFVVAGLVGFVLSNFLRDHSIRGSAIISFLAWIIVFYFVPKLLLRYKP